MRASCALVTASILGITNALAYRRNGTMDAVTVTVTHTSWSTLFSSLSCPTTTVTLCNAQCTAAPTAVANKADVVYETLSNCQAGQVVTISGTETTLAQPTSLIVEKTVSDLMVMPGSATDSGYTYTAAATITNIVYPSSFSANEGQVVTCQTGVITVTDGGEVLTNCPCTVQSTILEVTATGYGPFPTALVPSVSTEYIVKIIYFYIVEYIVDQIPTTITRTATSTLTTVQTETQTKTATQTEIATTTAAPTSLSCPPDMATVNDVVFMLECDTSYNGVIVNNLRKRQTFNLPGVSEALYSCLSQCSGQGDCVALSFDDSTSECSILTQFDAQSRVTTPGNIFATVVSRPTSPSKIPSTDPSTMPSTSPSTNLSASVSASDSSRPSSSASASISSVSGPPTSPSSISTTGASISSTSESSSKSRSSSVPYPISNSSVISTTSSSRRTSSASVVLPLTSSSLGPISTPSTIPSLNSSSFAMSTQSSISNSSVIFITPTTSSSFVSSTIRPVTNSSTTAAPSTTPVDALTNCEVAKDLLDYGPASSYCSSIYPVTASTTLFDSTITDVVTSTGPATTVIMNVTMSTQTIIQTLQASTTTTIIVPSEFIIDQTVTYTTIETALPSITESINHRKRQALPSVQASVFSSILARPSPDVAFVCSCLQPVPTISITDVQTVFSTSTVTPVVSNNVTIVPSAITLQTTETATITETITTIDTTVTQSHDVITTTTVQPPAPAPSSCNNEGIRWAIYPNSVYNSDNMYSGYDPTVIKSESPEYQATASVCGGLYESDVGQISIYGSTQTFESDYFTLNHVGYIFAQSSGTYTFTLTQPDDIALLWLGSNAYSGWTRANADATAVIFGNPSASATIDLVQGQYLPFRIVFGQAQGAISFYLSVAAPDGTVILNSNTPNSQFLVRFSCDGTLAPEFPPFGSET
ncbi:hypothetical protein KCU71_g3916, partial [Aureobasidium melanogenum]